MDDFFSSLRDKLYDLGIRNGETVYISSDVTNLLLFAASRGIKTSNDVNKFLNRFVDVFKENSGGGGNLLFPLFTWSFCKGKTFDYRITPGVTGYLGNWILKNRNDFSRTTHPIYSFVVYGKNLDYLVSMKNIDSWGDDSPFSWLHEINALQLFFDVTIQKGFTFMHYVEEKIHVPYRYMKAFTSEYIDKDGVSSTRQYKMFVRDLSIVSHEKELDDFFDKHSLTNQTSIENLSLKTVRMKPAFEIIKQDFLENGGRNCYLFDNYEIDWNVKQTHPDQI